MGTGLETLGLLLDERGPCPVCDADDDTCTHAFYGDQHYRLGDPREKHPLIGRRHVPSPRFIYDADGRLLFAKGDPMTDDEAARYGVAIPAPAAPARKKGHRA